jgi:SAM-dependent methyltransferase
MNKKNSLIEHVPALEYAPFDRDVQERGGYKYTDGARLSARIANERYTRLILDSTDFRGKSVLDVGSGDGTYTVELARLSGASLVVGIEPSSKAVERAAALCKDVPNLRFLRGFSEMLLESGERFDIAVYRGVIHHVAHPERELRCALCLATTVIILEPNGLNPLMKLVERASSYHKEHNERSHSPRTVRKWIGDADGVVRSLRFFGLVPYFCPDLVATLGRALEPLIESLPLIRTVCCGQYLMVAERKTP